MQKDEKSPCCRVEIVNFPQYNLLVCGYCKAEIKPADIDKMS